MAKRDLPLAFVASLAQNPTAMKNFENMSDRDQEAVLNSLKQVASGKEMKKLVNDLANSNSGTDQQGKSATDNQWISTGTPSTPDHRPRQDGPGGN